MTKPSCTQGTRRGRAGADRRPTAGEAPETEPSWAEPVPPAEPGSAGGVGLSDRRAGPEDRPIELVLRSQERSRQPAKVVELLGRAGTDSRQAVLQHFRADSKGLLEAPCRHGRARWRQPYPLPVASRSVAGPQAQRRHDSGHGQSDTSHGDAHCSSLVHWTRLDSRSEDWSSRSTVSARSPFLGDGTRDPSEARPIPRGLAGPSEDLAPLASARAGEDQRDALRPGCTPRRAATIPERIRAWRWKLRAATPSVRRPASS